MDVTAAIGAECDQIFVYIVTQQASRANVMDLETIGHNNEFTASGCRIHAVLNSRSRS
jgi:hypothetical protein